MKKFIYELTDPETNKPRYVGKTNKPKRRLRDHIRCCNKIGAWTPKNKWIRSLKDKGLVPNMNIINETETNNINELEIAHIKDYREIYEDLTNVANGGDGFDWTGRKHEEESIKRMKFNHPFRKVILQFDMDNNFIHKFESSKELGVSRKHAVRCCKGLAKQHKGHYYRFPDNFFPCVLAKPIENMDEIQKILDNNKLEKLPTKRRQKTIDKNMKIKEEKIKNRKPQKIYVQYDLKGNILGVFKGMAEACRKSGCHSHLISFCCKNKQYYTVFNTTFRYEGDIFDYVPYNKYVQVGSKKVSKYTLDGILVAEYDSIKRAAAELGGKSNEANISRCCNQKYNQKSGKSLVVKRFTYRFSEDKF